MSWLANAFEAVLGAVFLDAGYDAAYHYYLDRYRSLPAPLRDENFKGRLQQVAQERFGETPVYDSEGARVGNRREYTSVVFAGAEPLGTGHLHLLTCPQVCSSGPCNCWASKPLPGRPRSSSTAA